MSSDAQPDPEEATQHTRLPPPARLVLGLAAGVLVLALLLMAVWPLLSSLPLPAFRHIGLGPFGRVPMLYRYDGSTVTVNDILGVTQTAPAPVLTATFNPTPVRPLRSGEHPAQVALEVLVFGPFASEQAVQQFLQALQQTDADRETPDVGCCGRVPQEPWPQPPAVGAAQRVLSDSGAVVVLRLDVPAALPAGRYVYYAGVPRGQDGGGSEASITILPANPPLSRPNIPDGFTR